MQRFLSLATGGQAVGGRRVLRCHSQFKHAINLVCRQHGTLFTLHQYGTDLSPMGWLLRRDDFYVISRLLISNPVVQLLPDRLQGEHFQIVLRRPLQLTIETAQCSDFLTEILSDCHQLTGLSGRLSVAIFNHDTYPVSLLYQGLSQWWQDSKTETLLHLIGLGPGLTPSGDDMAVGAIAVLFSDKQVQKKLWQYPIFNTLPPLTQLTTDISACYLNHANNGVFSLALLRVMRYLNQWQHLQYAVQRLLYHGHTSGADTLLGLYTGIRWLNDFYQGSSFYAGSRNASCLC